MSLLDSFSWVVGYIPGLSLTELWSSNEVIGVIDRCDVTLSAQCGEKTFFNDTFLGILMCLLLELMLVLPRFQIYPARILPPFIFQSFSYILYLENHCQFFASIKSTFCHFWITFHHFHVKTLVGYFRNYKVVIPRSSPTMWTFFGTHTTVPALLTLNWHLDCFDKSPREIEPLILLFCNQISSYNCPHTFWVFQMLHQWMFQEFDEVWGWLDWGLFCIHPVVLDLGLWFFVAG